MRFLFIAVMVISLNACGPGSSKAPSPLTPSSGLALSGKEIWEAQDNGVLLHRNSGVALPQIAAKYQRGKVIEYRPDGGDVSVGYHPVNKDKYSEITIYISKYPGLNLNDYLGSAVDAIRQRFTNFKLIHEGEFKPETEKEYTGPVVVFEGTDRKRKLKTGVWMVQKGDWFVKARFTYEVDDSSPENMVREMLMAELNKPSAKLNDEDRKPLQITIQNKDGLIMDSVPIFEAIKLIPIGDIKP